MIVEEPLDKPSDGCRILTHRAHDNDTCVTAWGIASNISETSIERHDDSLIVSCGCLYSLVVCPGQSLVSDGVYFVTAIRENASQVNREVLIKLEPHP
jgi:hypothetical protein